MIQPASRHTGQQSDRHELQGRTEAEVTWFQRRAFLTAAGAWTAAGGWSAAQAQQRSNVVDVRGDALVNGQPIRREQTIQTGDQVQTGPDSSLVFVIGNSSFLVRQNTRMTVERGTTLFTVSVLRLLTGAVASVWGKGTPRRIVTPTLTAGIRGTGVYTEVLEQQNYRSYFCNCYGTVDLNASGSKAESQAVYHQSFWAENNDRNGSYLQPARAINHTDEELEYLAKLVNQRTAWQIMGRRGSMDGKGVIDGESGYGYGYK